jgi:prephenate dehydrogenase
MDFINLFSNYPGMFRRKKGSRMKEIGLIGFGRFGKLIVKFLSKDFRLKVFDKNLSETDFDSWKLSNVSKINCSNISSASIDDICKTGIILLSVPISSIETVVKKIKDKVDPNTLLVDFCSVKKYPLSIMAKFLPSSVFILGTHPLFGPDSVSDSLLNKKVIVCPKRIPKEQMDNIVSYLKELGLNVIISTDDQHDKRTAYTLCMTQFIGRGLAKFHMKEEEFDTLTFNELLHIKNVVLNDTKQLFYDMQTFNPYAKEMRKQLLKDFSEVEKKLNSKK